jgi:predicted nucleic-acid-binding Zn-ribbon protein
MRAKCPKCGAVFEVEVGLSLVHVGPWRYTKCPACGKRSMMNNFVTDEVTWPPEEHKPRSEPLSDEELKRKRIEDSKSEEPERDDRRDSDGSK